eukprot:TRINITY_DN3491_c0_g1_i1.p1 TRINITY_DN3491_c0_g1~~TRINITY_DN3491_c0_g1_i1.p1  ORF type:complete len:377 (+),score=152.38 TRINITY_DN3491_c0_g1_i1:86-1132(+)
MSDKLEKIKKQVEFYFSDSNYPKDKFLQGEAAKNPDGFIPLSVITSFNRMKSLTTNSEDVLNALADSTVVSLSEDKTLIKRAIPLPENDTSIKRTIYAKRFPEGTTIEEVSDFFAAHGKVLCVRLRKTKEKIFKRSVFVEFATEEEAQEVVKKKLTYQGEELTLMMITDYNLSKKEEMKQKKFPKKQKREGEEGKGEEEGGEKEQKLRDYPPGLVLHFEGIGKIELKELKELFNSVGLVQFLNRERDATDGHVRFETAEDAQKVLKEFGENKKEIAGQVATFRLLSGDEEKKYWEQVWTDKKKENGRERQMGKQQKKGWRWKEELFKKEEKNIKSGSLFDSLSTKMHQ